jgi:hypothetical protein
VGIDAPISALGGITNTSGASQTAPDRFQVHFGCLSALILAAILQQIAHNIVMISLSSWRINLPQAQFGRLSP